MTTSTPPVTLATWLLAQLDAEQAVAEAATRALSEWDCWAAVGSDAIEIRRYEVGAHIAAQDPATTLARIAAVRTVVELHREVVLSDKPYGDVLNESYCAECRDHAPCPTLRALAQPYAGRPGFKEEWA
jgi:hypothetical protein